MGSQEAVLAKCQSDCDRIAASVRFQHSRGFLTFASKTRLEIIAVYQKELLLKDSKDVQSAPEAIFLELDQAAEPAVGKIHSFLVEGLAVASEWSWKYGRKASTAAAGAPSADAAPA